MTDLALVRRENALTLDWTGRAAERHTRGAYHGADALAEWSPNKDDEQPEIVHLLDPIVAEQAEQARFRAASPRERVTPEQLDGLLTYAMPPSEGPLASRTDGILPSGEERHAAQIAALHGTTRVTDEGVIVKGLKVSPATGQRRRHGLDGVHAL